MQKIQINGITHDTYQFNTYNLYITVSIQSSEYKMHAILIGKCVKCFAFLNLIEIIYAEISIISIVASENDNVESGRKRLQKFSQLYILMEEQNL